MSAVYLSPLLSLTLSLCADLVILAPAVAFYPSRLILFY